MAAGASSAVLCSLSMAASRPLTRRRGPSAEPQPRRNGASCRNKGKSEAGNEVCRVSTSQDASSREPHPHTAASSPTWLRTPSLFLPLRPQTHRYGPVPFGPVPNFPLTSIRKNGTASLHPIIPLIPFAQDTVVRLYLCLAATHICFPRSLPLIPYRHGPPHVQDGRLGLPRRRRRRHDHRNRRPDLRRLRRRRHGQLPRRRRTSPTASPTKSARPSASPSPTMPS